MEREEVEISCSSCGEKSKRVGPLGTCLSCGGILTVEYPIDDFSKIPAASLFEGNSIWRYSKLLPIETKDIPISLGEGGTALLRARRLGEILGMGKIFLKNETTNPTGCFADRGTAVEMTYARDSGYRSVACALSGNLAASVAAYSARAGIDSLAFLPPNVDMGKLYQIVAYGAKIIPVSDQGEAESAMLQLGEECHRITSQSPFFLEGIKTTGLEIAEQLEWRAPDRIVLSIGNGSHFTMIWKALKELEWLGLIDASETRMTGVQMAGWAHIVEAFSKKESYTSDRKIHLAREIAVEHPQMTDKAIQTIRESDGTAIAVEEKEIIDAVQLLARAEGIFAEPAGAASIAGLRRLLEQGEIDRGERVVCIITGTGLKEPIAPLKMMQRFAGARRISQRMERRIRMLDLGTTKETIIGLLGRGSDYGYRIWKRLRDEKKINITVVSVYQHLSELEAADLVKKERVERSPTRRMRVFYRLTARGEKFLTNEENEKKRF